MLQVMAKFPVSPAQHSRHVQVKVHGSSDEEESRKAKRRQAVKPPCVKGMI